MTLVEKMIAAMLWSRGHEPYDLTGNDEVELYWQTFVPDMIAAIDVAIEEARDQKNDGAVAFLQKIRDTAENEIA